MKKDRIQKIEKKKRKFLYKKYGDLINKDPVEIPTEHRCKLNGGLRCFRRYEKIKENDVKKFRCGNPASSGSLFCKRHGGGNTKAVTTGTFSTTAIMYAGVHKNELKDILLSFLNDPCILDLKPELANARTLLRTYIEKLSNAKPKNPNRFVMIIKNILDDKDTTSMDKYMAIKILVEEQASLMDGRAIDRINRTIETIGRTVDRINKSVNKNDFVLTPDGLKIILRAIVEIIKSFVIDKDIQTRIREELLKISTLTKGDLSSLNTKPLLEEKETININAIVKDKQEQDLSKA